MGYKETYESWVNSSYFDDKTREELRGIAADDQEIKERFTKIWSLVRLALEASSARAQTG